MSNIPLTERRKWVGGSESAALLGLSPFATPYKLWHLKKGNIEPDNLDHDERVMAGKFMEPAIAAWAGHKWDWPIRKVGEYRRSPRVRAMGASLDFEVVGTREPTEIKNVDRSIFSNPKGEWEASGDTLINAPVHYLVQVQHEMACPEPGQPMAERGWLVVCVGGNRLFRMEVPRHDGLIQKLETEIDEFWASIARNEPPPPDFREDADTISLLYTGKGGEVADLRNNPRATELASGYIANHEIEKRAKEGKTAALAELKSMMDDRQSALIDGGYTVSASYIKAHVSKVGAFWRFNVRATK